MASSFTCGQKDEFMIGEYNLDGIFDNIINNNDDMLMLRMRIENDEHGYLTKDKKCDEFIDALNGTDTGNFLWGFIGHLVRGKILYAPNDDFTTSIMEEANKTFLII